jgi:SAM-dependent MidA family methyltransferase
MVQSDNASKVGSLPLAERLRERIRRAGAITFREWMQSALYDESRGYYARRDLTKWGRRGDYRTSPERSPLFAATFARFFASLDTDLGAPETFTILEAGAGGGNFAYGVLQTFRNFYPDIYARTRYLIDEASTDARSRILDVIEPFAGHIEFKRLLESDAEINNAVIFSNELFDAFPVHRVLMREGQLSEMYVGLDARGEFVWTSRELSTPRLAAYLQNDAASLHEGQIVEVNLDVEDWFARVNQVSGRRVYLVTVDYGATSEELRAAPHRRAGTLRAFSQHRLAGNVLANPGAQDLTTTIDWTQLQRVGEKNNFAIVSFERQDEFLLRAGLLDELERMTSTMTSEAARMALRTSAREMILPGWMSTSFQVLVQLHTGSAGIMPA